MAKKLVPTATLLALALLLSGCGDNQNQNHSAMDHSKATMPDTKSGTAAKGGGTYVDQIIANPALTSELFNSDGEKFTLESLKGKYIVIANFLTSCQEICPMTSVNIRDIANAITNSGESNEIVAMVLSVDSERDTPARLNEYKKLFGDSKWIVASGSKSSLDKIWKYFGAPAKRETYSSTEMKEMPRDWQTGKVNTYDVMHADLVVIVDKESRWRWLNLGSPKTKNGQVPEKLKSFLSQQGLDNLVKPEEPTWSVESVISALNELTGAKIEA